MTAWFSATRLQNLFKLRMNVWQIGNLLAIWHKELPDEVTEKRHTSRGQQWHIVIPEEK